MVGGQWRASFLEPDAHVYCLHFPLEPLRVLLVIDDNEGIAIAFRAYLAGYPYAVVGATTGTEALQLASQLDPLAITLDILMPSPDGWEILQALKTDPQTESIPVIICSVLDDPELARSLGAAAYLRKPVSQADLLCALDKLARTR